MSTSHGGARSGAGRKPGQKSRLTREQKRTLVEIASDYTSDAVRTLADIMRDKKAPAAARATCANSLLDRAHGKARQPVEHDLDLSRLSDEQLVALAIALGANTAIELGAGGAPPPESRH